MAMLRTVIPANTEIVWGGIAAVGGTVLSNFLGWDQSLEVLLVAMVIDYITGVLAAYINPHMALNSQKGFKGICKKIIIILLVALAHELDKMTGQPLVQTMVVWFFIGNEGLSIIENAAKAGLPIPQKLRKTLEQLANEKGAKTMKVFINPGHAPNGNPDPGAVNAKTGLRESDVAAAVGNAVAQYLINAGVAAAVLQHDDLATVCDTANASGADLFISIHCNAAESAAALGTETYCYPGSAVGQALANAVQRQIVDSLHTVDRGVKLAIPGVNGLYVLNNTSMPAILVELAFISNDHDEQLLANYQDAFARAIARGVTDYQLMQ